MPSQRRVRLLFYVVLAGVITMLFFTSSLRQKQSADSRTIQDFYHRTKSAIDKARGGGNSQQVLDGGKAPLVDQDGDGDIDEDDRRLAKQMADRLKAAEKKAKDSANAKAPNKPDHPEKVIGVGSSAGGQSGKKNVAKSEKEDDNEETDVEHAVEQELNTILKKSPVIIFSKTFCPYSKKAKGLLTEKYVIDPAPYIVELDKHPLGKKIQDRLADMTGRTTVPNILVNGKSIGGSDEIAEFDREKTLTEKIKAIGGNPVEVTERFVEDVQRPVKHA